MEYTVKYGRRQKGMAALIITITILVVVTIITLFTARVIVTDNKILNNVKNNTDALNAAQAGFGYALGYLNAYPYIVANGLGYCAVASNTFVLTPVGALTNGATYTMTFSCITAGSFITINLAAVGTSQDGTSTRTVSGTLKQFCGVGLPLISRGNVLLSNTALVSNPISGATRSIDSAGTVNLNSTSTATTATGGSYSCAASYASPPSTTCLNIRSSNATPTTAALGTITNANFQQLYLGRLVSDFSSLATVYNIDCTSAGNKSFDQTTTWAGAGGGTGCVKSGTGTSTTLNGITGAIIYMNMANRNLTLTTSSTSAFTLGTAAAPVLLVINSTTGNVTITTANPAGGNSMTINGNIFTTSTTVVINKGTNGVTAVNANIFGLGTVDIAGNAATGPVVTGAIISNASTITQGSNLIYNPNQTQFFSPPFFQMRLVQSLVMLKHSSPEWIIQMPILVPYRLLNVRP